jgi:hypothetical protein
VRSPAKSQVICPNPWQGQSIVARCWTNEAGALVLSPAPMPMIHVKHGAACHEAHALAQRHKTSFAVLTISSMVVNTPAPTKTYRMALMASPDARQGNRKLHACLSVEDELATQGNPLFRCWVSERMTVEVDQ